MLKIFKNLVKTIRLQPVLLGKILFFEYDKNQKIATLLMLIWHFSIKLLNLK